MIARPIIAVTAAFLAGCGMVSVTTSTSTKPPAAPGASQAANSPSPGTAPPPSEESAAPANGEFQLADLKSKLRGFKEANQPKQKNETTCKEARATVKNTGDKDHDEDTLVDLYAACIAFHPDYDRDHYLENTGQLVPWADPKELKTIKTRIGQRDCGMQRSACLNKCRVGDCYAKCDAVRNTCLVPYLQ